MESNPPPSAPEAGEIKACPWCGGTAWQIGPDEEANDAGFFACSDRLGCGARGPTRYSRAEAISSWNSVASLRERVGDLEVMLRWAVNHPIGYSKRYRTDSGRFMIPREQDGPIMLDDDGTGLPLLTPAARKALGGSDARALRPESGA